MRQRQPAPNLVPQVLALGAVELVVALVGLVLPANIFDNKPRLLFNEPARDIYAKSHFLLAVVLVLLAASWLVAVLLSRRLKEDRVMRPLVVLAVALAVVFAIAFPSGSRDLFHNIADSRTLWIYSDNPLKVPPAAHIDEVSKLATTFRQAPGPYGPLFYVIEGVPVAIAQNSVEANVFAFKLMNAAFLVLLAYVVAKEADRLSPGRRQQAFVAIAWNPFILYDSVTNGHNDIMMGTFIVLGLVMAAKNDALQSMAFELGALLIKYAAVVLIPITLWWWWRDRRGPVVLAAAGAFGAVCVLVLAVMFLRNDANLAIARSILFEGDLFRSGPWLIDWLARKLSFGDAKAFAHVATLVVFGAISLYALYRMDDKATSFYAAAFVILAAMVFLMVGRNFPWYAIWFLPIGFMMPGWRMLAISLTISLADLLFYIYFPWNPISDATQVLYVLTAWLLPVLIAVAPATIIPSTRRIEAPVT